MEYTPNIIIKCLSTQAVYINRAPNQMFYFTDKGQIFYDNQNGNRIQAQDILIINYERERNNYIPDNRSSFATELDATTNDQNLLNYVYAYVIETNCLYKYTYVNRTWQTIYGMYGVTVVAQTYTPEGDALVVNADDVTVNGILGDGSVIVRDANRMVCGQLRSDGYTFSIKSLIGGQMNLEPSGSDISDGCLQLNAQAGSFGANLNGNLVVFGNIKTTPKTNWAKQYRLVTQDIKIISNSVIKAGSLMKAGSILGETKYEEDTNLSEDTTVNIGMVVVNSKLYIGSSINNETVKPPYLFDIGETDVFSIPTHTTCTEWELKDGDTTLKLFMKTPFSANGDCVYINNDGGADFRRVKIVEFAEASYFTKWVAGEGLEGLVTIKFSAFDSTVKIMP